MLHMYYEMTCLFAICLFVTVTLCYYCVTICYCHLIATILINETVCSFEVSRQKKKKNV